MTERKEKEILTNVISFRVTEEQYYTIREHLTNEEVRYLLLNLINTNSKEIEIAKQITREQTIKKYEKKIEMLRNANNE